MTEDKNSRTVVVTGAAQGIGKAVSLRILKEGWNVIATDKNAQRLNQFASDINSTALRTEVFDVTNYAEVVEFFKGLETEKINLYGLVNNAGIFRGVPFLEYTEDDINAVLSVNLTGAIIMTQQFGKLLTPQHRNGVIVNIASIAGQIGSSDAIYGISKSGVLGLTKTTAIALAPNIRVNAVAPTLVETELLKSVSKERIEVFRQGELIKSAVLPEDIADSVWFLLSDQSKHYTGAVLDINNGFNLR